MKDKLNKLADKCDDLASEVLNVTESFMRKYLDTTMKETYTVAYNLKRQAESLRKTAEHV